MTYIHAANATKLVNLAHSSKEQVFLRRDRITVDAKSILGVMSLVFFEGVSVETKDHEIAEKIREVMHGD
jgi:phosphotransferase system HPr (HPr) family protein